MFKIKHLIKNTMNEANRNFIAEGLQDKVTQLQIDTCNRISKQADLGFINASNFQCLLSVSSLILNALEAHEILSESQFSNILNLYNKVIYAANV